jgi:hypothetical protein
MSGNDDLAPLITRTNELLSVLVKLELRAVVAAELTDEKKRNLYDLTGGTLPIKEIAAKVGMSTGAISATWQKWDEAGLLMRRGGKYRRTLE